MSAVFIVVIDGPTAGIVTREPLDGEVMLYNVDAVVLAQRWLRMLLSMNATACNVTVARRADCKGVDPR